MNFSPKSTALTFLAGTALVASAQAAEVLVTANIATSTTWTANNTYNLQQQIYVLPGATLTIEAGTKIISDTGVGGSLAVAAGGQIFVQGTASDPVIMTSKADEATWVGGDPTTGTWREAVNEWGNLTLMGKGYISENATIGNTPVPAASNVAAMEGLVEDFPGDPKVLYGGGDDDDDSGSISHLSIRYGGRVLGLNNELNGMSLGGIGRGTDISHVEIMNNVDDGIEIWGGTVHLDHVVIMNIGDDSLDIDQGWRGKAQFGLIVQGYSADASQGSGVGDNMFETDGAEDSDWQPVTTAVIANFTALGQPVDGDQGTAWRDNARVQYYNCIWQDVGDQVVKLDNVDGDGANGYGHNGTLSWAATWTTPYTATSTVNAPANPAAFYQAQTQGNLAQIQNSVFFRNQGASAYTEANAVGVFAPANNNVQLPGIQDTQSPIAEVVRTGPVVKGGKTMFPVVGIDPRPVNGAEDVGASAPNDGYFQQVTYAGGFAPAPLQPWTAGWTALEAFGFQSVDDSLALFCDPANVNSSGNSVTLGGASFTGPGEIHLEATGGPANQFGYFIVSSLTTAGSPVSQGQICLGLPIGRYNPVSAANQGLPELNSLAQFDAGGVLQSITGNSTVGSGFDVPSTLPAPLAIPIAPGSTWHFQLWYRDGAASNFSNGLSVTFP